MLNRQCTFQDFEPNMITMHLKEYTNPALIRYHSLKSGLTLSETNRLFEKLKSFLNESANSTERLSPTREVDAIWHSFILHTEEYASFCQTFFNQFIHHRPLETGKLASSLEDAGNLPGSFHPIAADCTAVRNLRMSDFADCDDVIEASHAPLADCDAGGESKCQNFTYCNSFVLVRTNEHSYGYARRLSNFSLFATVIPVPLILSIHFLLKKTILFPSFWHYTILIASAAILFYFCYRMTLNFRSLWVKSVLSLFLAVPV